MVVQRWVNRRIRGLAKGEERCTYEREGAPPAPGENDGW